MTRRDMQCHVILEVMPTTRDELDRLMQARQQWLVDDWVDIARRGGVPYRTIARFRHDPKPATTRTRRGIEAGLHWPRGIIDTILSARDPVGRFDYLIKLPVDGQRVVGRPRHTADILSATLEDLAQTWRYIEQAGSRARADKWLGDALRLRDRGESRLDVLGETG